MCAECPTGRFSGGFIGTHPELVEVPGIAVAALTGDKPGAEGERHRVSACDRNEAIENGLNAGRHALTRLLVEAVEG